MTGLLERAIAEIEKLPDDLQDAIAARILADLADEKEWEAKFESTTDEQWDKLANLARRHIAEDLTPLDQVFPPTNSQK